MVASLGAAIIAIFVAPLLVGWLWDCARDVRMRTWADWIRQVRMRDWRSRMLDEIDHGP